MTEFSIYQINTDRDDNRICFLGLDTLERIQQSKAVDPALYDRVYDGKLDCNSLETIFEKFNIDHPADYNGRSLSVSDVVEIRESDTLNPGFYFVDSIAILNARIAPDNDKMIREIDHKVVINGKPYFLAHAYTVGRDFTFTHGWYIVDRETGDLYKAYAAADLYYYVEKD